MTRDPGPGQHAARRWSEAACDAVCRPHSLDLRAPRTRIGALHGSAALRARRISMRLQIYFSSAVDRPKVDRRRGEEPPPMKYMMLIYSNEKAWQNMTEADQGAVFGEYMAYTEEMKRTGKWIAGEALQPTSTATTVRTQNGRPIHIDGPFAETKEQLGGFYMLECKDLDEALAWAARAPETVRGLGSTEVRPLMVFDA
jgi:hypothetical protein